MLNIVVSERDGNLIDDDGNILSYINKGGAQDSANCLNK
jgi:hypothetical protein